MRFCTATLGCKANQYDTETIAGILAERGFIQVKPGSGCDICVVNTCAVTAESVRKSKQTVRRMRKYEPDAIIAVCGCFTGLEGKAAATALGADVAGGTGDKEAFTDEIVNEYTKRHNLNPVVFNEVSDTGILQMPGSYNKSRTRALLKIQDGCDNYCAYCVIPYARGHSRSKSLAGITHEAAELYVQGYKEIVITGIEISSFKPCLITAIKAVNTAAPNVRLRLGSLHPCVLTASFIEQSAVIPNLCNHFHISLQSGCDEILDKMYRKYETKQVMDAITKLRNKFDNCGITADVITGFPGETDSHFDETVKFIKKAAFSAMHIFPYSPRPETAAAKLPEQVAANVKQKRAKILAAIAKELSDNFKRSQIGKTLDVLIESRKENRSTGHSGNYLVVAVDEKIPKNTLTTVKITGIENGTLTGKTI